MIRAAMRFSWAMSLFGMQQAMRMVSALRSGQPLDAIAEAFDALSQAASRGMKFGADSVKLAGAAEPIVELPLRVAVDDRHQPSEASHRLLRGTLEALQEGAETLRVLAPTHETQLACREFKNKLEAFESFQYAYAILDLERQAAPITERVVRVARLETWRGVWVMEGLGYGFAEEAWDEGTPRSLLNQPQIDALPQASRIPLHTGMGLLFARRTLGPGRQEPLTDGRDRVVRFIELCKHNARQGYGDAMFEALGLVVRNLHPNSLAMVDGWLAQIAPKQRQVFWHGAGRALYFNLTQSLSGASVLWRGIEKIHREAPDSTSSLNALAGLAWAVTLVNLRHPEVIEAFLGQFAERLQDDERAAFSNGVASAASLWFDAVGFDPHLEGFCDHQPRTESLAQLWDQLIRQPCETAIAAYPDLAVEQGPGRLFHFEP